MTSAGEVTTEPVIATMGLTKRFGAQVAVNSLDLLVPSGAVYGFLGPNGSGKTTTIRLLLGLAFATSGRISVLGHRIPRQTGDVLPRVGALVEGPAFHPYLSGRLNLRRLDAADRSVDPKTTKTRVDAALDRVGLLSAATKKYRAYSLGMRQRLAIAAALLSPRELLILDEPTNGLDPQGTREIRHLVQSLSDDGTTVLVSSHLLSEVEQMCTHVGVMHAGNLLAQGTMAEVRGASKPIAVVRTSQPTEAAVVLRRLGLAGVVTTVDSARGELGDQAPERIVDEMVHSRVGVRGFSVDTASLEDLFVALTGEGFDVSG